MRGSFFKILILALIIASLGVLSIYSSTSQKEGMLWQEIYKRQLLWIMIGLVFFFLMSRFNYRKLWDANYFIYGAALFFLLLVFGLGVIRMGAQRWLKLAWFNFQPSEFAKLAMIIFLARYFSRKSIDDTSLSSGKFGIFQGIILPFIFVGMPMFLIIEQPDLGSGLMLMLIFVGLLYLTHVRLKYIFMLLAVLILPLPFFWHFLHDYQKQRLLVFLNPNIDPLGAGYTVIQSRIAIGSGGFFGRGWLRGSQSQLYFLPESHTDFIFATFSEQWGFLGSVLLILMYYLIIRQGFIIAQRTQDAFGRLLAYGISLLLTLQVFINIAMNLGLAPVVGLPLPMMSYGGSSVLITFVALGILVNIDRTRNVF
ncbi:MAG: rod shape-determining protein RodA [Candidatus Omnitrophica bacterium]|nr:rod shape-determining protein RodA [Candidatus Omnitrophota bacterium]MBU4303359.1 rod shape-determining protein RodA [Candidatus Omnitrophota bacterium]MBU4419285.1 rod shape-determining protein RodA [Candidatus Omnitrophota bacterium]MBU4467577.1 rod shape-determining protein RodA [Candidatus Omnitrophota bacterium]MCG2707230.1 rod shape-determining protein RodA [Candidatus Omnitrophota bacterium]